MPRPSPDAWAQIRLAYEHTDTPVEDICLAHGISSTTLRDRMRRWGWTRRRPPIPDEGPPPVTMTPRQPVSPPRPVAADEMAATAPPNDISMQPDRPIPPAVADAAADPVPPEAVEDAAAIVPRLQSAAARLLPAIEATIARLAAGPYHPREMEQAGRALSSLTRTLRELNALLARHQARAAEDGDYTEKDIEDIRSELAQRLHALIDAARDKEEEAKQGET